MAAANELQAATGLLVSELPQAGSTRTDKDTATRTLRMTDPSRATDSLASLAPSIFAIARGREAGDAGDRSCRCHTVGNGLANPNGHLQGTWTLQQQVHGEGTSR